MKQSKKKLLRKLQREEMNLNEAIIKLEAFIDSEDYHTLEWKQQNLLTGQHSAMLLYQRYLLDRINDIEGGHNEINKD